MPGHRFSSGGASHGFRGETGRPSPGGRLVPVSSGVRRGRGGEAGRGGSLGTPGLVRGDELGAAETPRVAEGLAPGAFGEGQQFLLVFVGVEQAETVLIVEGDLGLAGEERVEESLPGGADQLILLDHPQEELDEGVGELEADDLVDDEGEGGRPEVGEVPEALLLTMVFLDARSKSIGVPHVKRDFELAGEASAQSRVSPFEY